MRDNRAARPRQVPRRSVSDRRRISRGPRLRHGHGRHDGSHQRRCACGRSSARCAGTHLDTRHFAHRGRLPATDSATDITSSSHTTQQTNTPLPGVLPAGAVSTADRVWRGLPKTYRAKAGSMLAVFAVSVGVIAYVALDKAETAPERRTATTLPAKVFPAVAFRTKALVGAGSRPRERDARLVLAEGTVTVTADDDTGDRLHTVAYESVLSIDYSRGADPMWNGRQGPAVVARAPVGALRRIGVSIERHWISSAYEHRESVRHPARRRRAGQKSAVGTRGTHGACTTGT